MERTLSHSDEIRCKPATAWPPSQALRQPRNHHLFSRLVDGKTKKSIQGRRLKKPGPDNTLIHKCGKATTWMKKATYGAKGGGGSGVIHSIYLEHFVKGRRATHP